MLETRIDDIIANDLHAFLAVGIPEGPSVDYKLPGRPPDSDIPIVLSLNDDERRNLAKDVVAFANADGGWLIIGIRETGEEPARPAGIVPVIDCEQRAHTLRDQLVASTEPPVHGLKARGIPTVGTAGVILVYIPPSATAPHGVIHKDGRRVFAVRRNDQSTVLTVPEITELVIQTQNRTGAVIARLSQRRAAFELFDFDGKGAFPVAAAYRINLQPLRPRPHIPRLYRRVDLLGTKRLWQMQWEGRGSTSTAAPATHFDSWRPALEGAVAEQADVFEKRRLLTGEDGSVEAWFLRSRSEDGLDPRRIYFGWLAADIANVLEIGDRLRKEVGYGDSEMWLDVSLDVRPERRDRRNDPDRFMPVVVDSQWNDALKVPIPLAFPMIRVTDGASFDQAVARVMELMFNAAGEPFEQAFAMQWR